MQAHHVTRSFGFLLMGVAIAAGITMFAPAPLALLLALVALPVEAFLLTSAIHGLSRPIPAGRLVR